MSSLDSFPFVRTLPYTSPIAPAPDSLNAEGKPLGPAPASTLTDGHVAQWVNANASIQERVTDAITRYLYLRGPQDKFYAVGRDRLLSTVSSLIERDEEIEIVFPAFPFKSPAAGVKVLGALPDYAEELLLARLEMMARTISDYYSKGCVIRVVSDGVVYGEILGRSDTLVYRYNDCLRQMAERLGFKHITFVRVVDLLNSTSTLDLRPMSEEEYVRSLPDIRSQFLAHEVPEFDLEKGLKEDVGMLATYRGYLKFLEADLEGSDIMSGLSKSAQDRQRRRIAKQMLLNGAKFSDLTALKFPDAVRISVHAHSNEGPKFAFDMFPGGDMSASPWHNVIMERANGALECQQLRAYDPSAYEIVEQDGRPYYIRERSAYRDFGENVNPFIQFQRNYPFGLVIQADKAKEISLSDLPMDKLRKLAEMYSFVLLRGFKNIDREAFKTKSREFGQIRMYPGFGEIFELKDNPSFDANSSLTCESMPMHYDGVFLTKPDPITGKPTHDPPNYQIFQCIQAPSSGEGGKTLLTNSSDLLKFGLTETQRQWLQERTWSTYTPLNKAFGGDLLKLPIIMPNDRTGNDVLRWHEPWPQYVTQYKYIDSWINDVPDDISTRVGSFLTELSYDRRFCYGHQWQTGDFLFADNIENLHTRTAFKPCPRELWRVHVN